MILWVRNPTGAIMLISTQVVASQKIGDNFRIYHTYGICEIPKQQIAYAFNGSKFYLSTITNKIIAFIK